MLIVLCVWLSVTRQMFITDAVRQPPCHACQVSMFTVWCVGLGGPVTGRCRRASQGTYMLFSCSSHLYLTSMMGDKTTSPQHTRTCFLMTNSFMLLLIELPFCTNVFQPYSYIFLKPVSGFEVWHFYITYVFLKLYIRCFSYFISIYILSVCNTCAIVTCFY